MQRVTELFIDSDRIETETQWSSGSLKTARQALSVLRVLDALLDVLRTPVSRITANPDHFRAAKISYGTSDRHPGTSSAYPHRGR